ncbi:sigma-70 family RNA polymerase sigma factor [Belliella sp. R4-6]|uniref:Sigma-70 family RNA polymerase sigma factor n=1 Tax=Belliella alkalica TaxID=1730871 RepID=A0ABS9VFL3_9BACT|nr:sigma-70 family RNA polymerase sigma factor [Belliella alkalica]MCH7415237.1 sigma-70 family RNA polymerase sigma factor [Belliella alkalica]
MEKDYHIESKVWMGFLKGNQDSFKQLYLKYIDDLIVYGSFFCRDRSRVEDSIHDVFVELFNRRENLSQNINVKFYLFACLRRQLKRTLKNFPILEFKEGNDRDLEIIDLNFDPIIHNEEQKLIVFKLVKAINQISKKKKEIIYLYYVQQLTYADISLLLGISLSSCRTLMYRAIKDLKANFEIDTMIPENIDLSLLKNAIQLSVACGFLIV